MFLLVLGTVRFCFSGRLWFQASCGGGAFFEWCRELSCRGEQWVEHCDGLFDVRFAIFLYFDLRYRLFGEGLLEFFLHCVLDVLIVVYFVLDEWDFVVGEHVEEWWMCCCLPEDVGRGYFEVVLEL